MYMISRSFLWFIAVAMVLGGVMFLIDFELIASELGLPNLVGHSRNTVTTDIGAGIFSFGFLIFLYLVNGRRWLWPAILVTAAIPILRYISFISDGWVEAAIPALVLESLTLIALLLMAFVYDRNKNIGTELFDGLNTKTFLFLHHWVAVIMVINGLSLFVGYQLHLAARETEDPLTVIAIITMIYATLYTMLGAIMWLKKSQLAAGLILLLQVGAFLGISLMFHESAIPAAIDKLLLVVTITNIAILLILFTHKNLWSVAISKSAP